MKKKIFALLLAAVMVFGLSACGSGTTEETDTADTTDTSADADTDDYSMTEDLMESLYGQTTEITIVTIESSDTTFSFDYSVEIDGETYTTSETFEIESGDEDYEDAAAFADECYGLTDSSVADLEPGDVVTVTFDDYGSISTMTIE